MKKILLIALLLVGCAHNIGETVKTCAHHPGERGPTMHCGTAFAIEKNEEIRFLTAAHIFGETWFDHKRWIEHDQFGAINLEIDYIDFDKDIAVFHVDPGYDFETYELCPIAPPFAALTAITESPEYGEASGYMLWTDYEEKSKDSDLIHTNIKSTHGYSGGPIIVDLNDCVTGMVLGGTEGDKKTIGIRVDDLRQALKRKMEI